jgi:hypothetical protein
MRLRGATCADRRGWPNDADADWQVLLDNNGSRVLTIQEKRDTTAPDLAVRHPDTGALGPQVPTVEDLDGHRERAEAMGAQLLHDRSKDESGASTRLPIRLVSCSAYWSSKTGGTPSPTAEPGGGNGRTRC